MTQSTPPQPQLHGCEIKVYNPDEHERLATRCYWSESALQVQCLIANVARPQVCSADGEKVPTYVIAIVHAGFARPNPLIN